MSGGDTAAQALGGQVRRLLERCAESSAGLDTATSRALLDDGQLGLCLDDLAFELDRAPPLDRAAVRALLDLAPAAGASDQAIARLTDVVTRRARLALTSEVAETPVGLAEFPVLTVDATPLVTLTFVVVLDPVRALGLLDRLDGHGDGDGPVRVEITSCTYCGDRGCGSDAWTVEVAADTVEWRDFVSSDGIERSAVAHGPFIFDRAPYRAVLARVRDGLRQR